MIVATRFDDTAPLPGGKAIVICACVCLWERVNFALSSSGVASRELRKMGKWKLNFKFTFIYYFYHESLVEIGEMDR